MTEPDPDQASSAFPRIAVAAALLVAVIAVIGFMLMRDDSEHTEGASPAPPTSAHERTARYAPPPDTGYLGSQACAECHQELFDSFREHPMYQSTRHITEDRDPPPSTTSPLPGKLRSLTADVKASAVTHHELMHDKVGQLIYDFAVSLDYVVGSGRKAKSYIYQRGAILSTSPLNWFADGSWDLNPGFIPDDPRRFDRRATAACLVCHTGRLSLEDRLADDFQTPPFHEAAIGCERCHGPGSEHVEYHNAGAQGLDPIVNPRKLGPVERDSICFQCHMPLETRILRSGRAHVDFRPGNRVEDIWTFTKPSRTVDAEGRAESVSTVQVHQMRESRCFEASDRKMTCTTCHDPHRIPGPSDRVTFYRDRCLTCHGRDACSSLPAGRDAVDDSCIVCHMPGREMKRTAHAAQTDHRILRTPDQIRDTSPIADVIRFFDKQDERLPEPERRRAMAIAVFRQGAPYDELLATELHDLVDAFPGDSELLLMSGTVAMSAGNLKEASHFFERATAFPAARNSALETLTQISYQAQQYERVVQYSDQFIEANPYSPLVYTLRADALLQVGKPKDAVESAARAVALNPSVVEVHVFLRDLYKRLGLEDEEQRQDKLIERMRSARPPGQ